MLLRIFISLGLTAMLVMGLKLGLEIRLPGWSVVAIYLIIYVLFEWRDLARPTARQRHQLPEPDPDYSWLPTSGPIGRFGQKGLILSFYVSQLFALFNPFQLVQLIRQIAGNSVLEAREKESGDDGRGYVSKAQYRLPFDGEWLLYNGGTTPKTSHSWGVLSQRFALDFVVCDDDYRRHSGRGTRLTDYFAYDLPVLAAADGEVIAIEKGIGAAPLVGWGICDFTARSFIGNHLVIRHAEGEYGLYAHLIRDSIRLKVGDVVQSGQIIGRCGHSGHSSEPHLHFHVQDSADLFRGMGLPITFHDIEIDGIAHCTAQPTAGQRVRNREARLIADVERI
jgi:murein DD-endopeptidase MepM/ murein hydrolase activator NlpD